LTARQRSWADSISLNAIASPAAREPGPLVILLLCLTVAKVDSIGFVVRTSQTTHAQLAAWIRGHWLMEGRLHRRRVRLGALRSPHPDPLAGWEPATCAVIAGMIARAAWRTSGEH